nr:hypothetical protein [Tanacetum cinerariifolium]
MVFYGNSPHVNDDINLVGLFEPYDLEAGNISKATEKRKHVAGPHGEEFPSAKELWDATDCHWVVAHVTSLSWKQHLKEISLEQLCDIHDRAYMHQAILDNAFQDLDKNPLVSDMRSKIEALKGPINGLHNKYNRLVLEEKKWVNYEQTLSTLHVRVKDLESEREKLKISKAQLLQEIDSLKQDKADVVTKVVPEEAMKLIQTDEMGILVAKLVKESMFHGTCAAFKEVDNLKEHFVLEKMPGYFLSSKEEFDRAGGSTYLKVTCVGVILTIQVSIATTWNLVPPDAIVSGPTMLILHCEKGHADIIGVISCFDFLGTGEWIWQVIGECSQFEFREGHRSQIAKGVCLLILIPSDVLY